jgi:hypothetical protein
LYVTEGTEQAAGMGIVGSLFSLPYFQSFTPPLGAFWDLPLSDSDERGTRTWDIVGDQLKLTGEVESGGSIFPLSPAFDLPSSYLVSVEVSQSPAAGVECGVRLGEADKTIHYFLVSAFHQSFAVFVIGDDGALQSIVDWTVDSSIRNGDVNQLELVVNGTEAVLKVNGQTLVDLAETSFSTAQRIGFAGAFTAGDEKECGFDNFLVIELSP